MQNIERSIDVGVEGCLAGFTSENISNSLSSPETSTDRTSLRSIFCSHIFNSNPVFLSFIFKELLELMESPVGEEPVLFSSVPCVSYPLQIFQDNYSIFPCIFNQSLANAVVDITHKPFLLARDLLKVSSGRASAFALQPTAKFNITLFNPESFFAINKPVLTCGNQIVYSPVNPYDVSCFIGRSEVPFNRNHKPEFSVFAENKVAFFNIPVNIFLKILRNFKVYLQSSIKGKKVCSALFKENVTTPLIIMDTGPLKFRSFSFILNSTFNRDASIFIGNYCKLCRELEFLPNIVINKLMHTKAIAILMLIATFNNFILSLRHIIHCFEQNISLFCCFVENCLYSFQHSNRCERELLKPSPQFLPPTSKWVSLEVLI